MALNMSMTVGPYNSVAVASGPAIKGGWQSRGGQVAITRCRVAITGGRVAITMWLPPTLTAPCRCQTLPRRGSVEG